MTNLEKIRAMTSKEMADLIKRIISCDDCPLFNNNCDIFHTCDEQLKKWLESEVEENDQL